MWSTLTYALQRYAETVSSICGTQKVVALIINLIKFCMSLLTLLKKGVNDIFNSCQVLCERTGTDQQDSGRNDSFVTGVQSSLT